MSDVRLRRLPRDEDGHSRYLHPHGYVIVQASREPESRVGRMNGQADWLGPMRWFEVFDHPASRAAEVGVRYHPWARRRTVRVREDHLREARAWCDNHPREGWAA